MKIFYTSSRDLPYEFKDSQIKCLKLLGHTISYRYRPKDYSNVTQKEAREVVKENMKRIRESDIVMADVSFPSSSLGYHISIGIDEKKPILILYNYKDLKVLTNLPTNLLGLPSKYLVFKEYSLSDNLLKFLELSINELKELLHTKFNFLVPPEINSYLEWQVKYKNRPKSELVREALEEKIEEDSEYQNYLNEL